MKEVKMMATMSGKQDEQRISSLDIAAVTGKQHKDVLKAIRNMESAWEKECGRKFALTSEKLSMPQGGFAQDRGTESDRDRGQPPDHDFMSRILCRRWVACRLGIWGRCVCPRCGCCRCHS